MKSKVKMADTRLLSTGLPDKKPSIIGFQVYIFYDSAFESHKHVVTKQQVHSEQEPGNERKQRKYTCSVML